MNVAVFAVILSMRVQGRAVERIDDLRGLSTTHPLVAFAVGVAMFAMAGIPPLAGFFSKFYVFDAAVRTGHYALAVIGVLTSVFGAFYYLRIVKVMYFDDVQAPLDARPQTLTMVMAISGIFTTLFFLMPAPLVRAAQEAVSALVG